jgi:hypothetical protein
MKSAVLMCLLLVSMVSCRSVPDAGPTARKFQPGTLGIVCRSGSLRGSVDRPASPGSAFVRASSRSLKASINAGIAATQEACGGDPWGAMFIGIPLMLTGAAAPVAGLVGAVATIPGQTPVEVAEELSLRLAGASDPEAIAAKLASAARGAGVPVASARGAAADNDGSGITDDCAAVRRLGATTLAHITVYGPSLTLRREYSSLTHLEVAMRVTLCDAASASVRRRFWVRHAVEPGRTLQAWYRQPGTLAAAVDEAIREVSADFAKRLPLEGGEGEVTRRYEAHTDGSSSVTLNARISTGRQSIRVRLPWP